MKLVTPFGEIEVLIDGKTIKYNYKKINPDLTCKDIDGRYLIQVSFVPDGKEHSISCRIRGYQASEMDGIETGENLELKSFYRGNSKLSIGMVGDTGYINGERISVFDYDNDYMDDGVEYVVLSNTKTQDYVFGIAWLNCCNKNNEVQTWFGADPTIIKL